MHSSMTTNEVIDLAANATSKCPTTMDWVFLGVSIFLVVTITALFIMGGKNDKDNHAYDEFFWDE